MPFTDKGQQPVKGTAVYALTPQGACLGQTLARKLTGDLFLPGVLAGDHGAVAFDGLLETVTKNFHLYARHVFIAASGIVVRAIAPHLTTKDQDPAVVVLDQEGDYVISLVSGHLGGANALAREVARHTGGRAVITTATDTAGVPAIDLLAGERDLAIANLKAVKSINMALLAGEPIQVFDPEDRLEFNRHLPAGFSIQWVDAEGQWIAETPGVWVTWQEKRPVHEVKQLILHPRCLVAGVGCNRGTTAGEIVALVKTAFQKEDLALHSLKCLTTIDAKRDEQGLLDAARELGAALVFYGKPELAAVRVPHPSRVVNNHMGVPSVCEATALLKSKGGRLLVPKTKSPNATLAVALEG
jgi:cobalt-precorrin 5A hydrolase